jgi:acyl carrier protein
MNKDELFNKCVDILHETFGIDRAKITPQSLLYEELDIDSIDAVDLIVRMKPLVGKRMTPEAFKAVRTVQDVVDALHTLIHTP